MATNFSAQSTSFRTTTEGTSVKLEGTTNFNETQITEVNGTIYKKDSGEFVGSYGMTSVNLNNPTDLSLLVESAQQLQALVSDIDKKRKEVYPVD